MAIYFTLAMVSLLAGGLGLFIVGLITIIRGYKNKNKDKVQRGWGLFATGIIVSAIIVPVLIKDIETGGSFVDGAGILILLFMPFSFIAVFVFLIFFLSFGTTSLKEGYTKDKDGKRDVPSIVLGYVMLILGAITIFSLVMFIGSTLTFIRDSISKANERFTSSSHPAALLLTLLL